MITLYGRCKLCKKWMDSRHMELFNHSHGIFYTCKDCVVEYGLYRDPEWKYSES